MATPRTERALSITTRTLSGPAQIGTSALQIMLRLRQRRLLRRTRPTPHVRAGVIRNARHYRCCRGVGRVGAGVRAGVRRPTARRRSVHEPIPLRAVPGVALPSADALLPRCWPGYRHGGSCGSAAVLSGPHLTQPRRDPRGRRGTSIIAPVPTVARRRAALLVAATAVAVATVVSVHLWWGRGRPCTEVAVCVLKLGGHVCRPGPCEIERHHRALVVDWVTAGAAVIWLGVIWLTMWRWAPPRSAA